FLGKVTEKVRNSHILCYQAELSHVGKLREVREVRGKLRDKCPNFKLEDYCLFTSRTTVGSDNFFNFNQFPHLRNLNYKVNICVNLG
ncbi:hypothetical protein, partial [Segatella copri]|uniref:hypothetical protein n=1 Tax=Segatella copri TaxID=165179 RepID=UPI001C48CD3D